jgi:MFS family permease
MQTPPPRVPHPIVWTILYLPFGALSGFVTVPMTFVATQSGLSISEGAYLNGAQLVSQWLKWTWAPAVDVTLSPKRWYVLGTLASSLGVFAMTAIPMGPSTLPLLLAVIATASLLNSIVGMSIESILAAVVPPEEHGRTSAWFQAGNLGGAGLGGGVGLTLFGWLPERWMAGAVMGALFLSCCAGLWFVPDVKGHAPAGGVAGAVRNVFADVVRLARTKGGLLAGVICFLPLGTGAAQGTLTQAAVAAEWGATDLHVAWTQGYTAAAVTAAGCFAGGWLCDRLHPRTAYAVVGGALSLIAVGIAVGPRTVEAYVAGNLVYAFGVGLAYAAFTALVLNAIGREAGATRYTIYASLSNFPIWWLGLLLGSVADGRGTAAMLLTEAGLVVAAIVVFLVVQPLVRATALPESLPEPAPAPAPATR